jgi:steroid delta-isomerase-like uncharacterized protein
MSEENKRIARKVFEDVLTERNLAVVDEFVATDYVGHTPLLELHGPEGAKQFDAMLHQAFPDLEITVEDQIAEGDKVATRWTARGTHEGEFQNIPPTGRRVEFSGIAIFRIADGEFVEGWNIPDLLGLLRQLGVVPGPSS